MPGSVGVTTPRTPEQASEGVVEVAVPCFPWSPRAQRELKPPTTGRNRHRLPPLLAADTDQVTRVETVVEVADAPAPFHAPRASVRRNNVVDAITGDGAFVYRVPAMPGVQHKRLYQLPDKYVLHNQVDESESCGCRCCCCHHRLIFPPTISIPRAQVMTAASGTCFVAAL